MQGLGADEVVDYTREDFATKYSALDLHFDAIIDLVGGTLLLGVTGRCLRSSFLPLLVYTPNWRRPHLCTRQGTWK